MAPKQAATPLCQPARGTARLPDGTEIAWRLDSQKRIVIGTAGQRLMARLQKTETELDAQHRVELKLKEVAGTRGPRIISPQYAHAACKAYQLTRRPSCAGSMSACSAPDSSDNPLPPSEAATDSTGTCSNRSDSASPDHARLRSPLPSRFDGASFDPCTQVEVRPSSARRRSLAARRPRLVTRRWRRRASRHRSVLRARRCQHRYATSASPWTTSQSRLGSRESFIQPAHRSRSPSTLLVPGARTIAAAWASSMRKCTTRPDTWCGRRGHA
jgi:hypothetical protein